jgi:hypothetical protein
MRHSLVTALLFITASAVFAQREVDKNTSWSAKDRMYFGLGIGGLGFGSHPQLGQYYSIGLTPMVGYMLVTNLSAGGAFEYQYQGYPDVKQSVTQYGWYPYLRYNIKNFFLQTDYDWYKVKGVEATFTRYNVGVGYFSQGSGRTAANFLVSYDLQYTSTGAFNSPLQIRIFLTF